MCTSGLHRGYWLRQCWQLSRRRQEYVKLPLPSSYSLSRSRETGEGGTFKWWSLAKTRAGQEQRYHIFKRMPCCTADSEEKVKGHSFFRSSYGTLQWSICEVLQLKMFSQSRDGITMVSLDPYKESGCVVYLDPFGCCALWAICIYILWPRESPPLHFSRQKILRSHSSGQSWASCEITIKSTTSSVRVWKHVYLVVVPFSNFFWKN